VFMYFSWSQSGSLVTNILQNVCCVPQKKVIQICNGMRVIFYT